LPQIKPDTHRNLLKTTTTDATTVSAADTVESDEWDPFHIDPGRPVSGGDY
jgi:hypothetical protein